MSQRSELPEDYGRLDDGGNGWSVSFRRVYPHPQEKVWRAITEPEHLSAWFPTDIIGERTPGAPLRFEHRGIDLPAMEGRMIAYEPPRLLEFRWGEDLLRFELEPHADGCLLTLTDVLDERGKAARDAAGWHECLDLLTASLAEQPPPFAWGERWGEVHPAYVESFGPEASSIGPPEELLVQQKST